MHLDKSADTFATVATRPPARIWLLTLLLGLMAFVSVVGSFLFAFPMGGFLGYSGGTLLIIAGIGYSIIVWRMRHGERTIWIAAIILPIVHTLGLNSLDLVLHGAIPSGDFPFMGVALAIVLLLLLPTTRHFFTK